jgi:hypothetical protein
MRHDVELQGGECKARSRVVLPVQWLGVAQQQNGNEIIGFFQSITSAPHKNSASPPHKSARTLI